MFVVSVARARQLVGDLLLNLLALAGLLCIALTIAAQIFDVSVVMFRTGSMSPTMPTGSAALVRQVPATQVGIGDVVTVDRSPRLPVTHRVISIDRRDGAAVTFRMQGDANDEPDLEAYTRSQVGEVLFAVPGAARVIVWFTDPRVLAALTVGASCLVAWAFWPRGGPGRASGQRRGTPIPVRVRVPR